MISSKNEFSKVFDEIIDGKTYQKKAVYSYHEKNEDTIVEKIKLIREVPK